ncbi:MAG: DNA translocase FtsK, partial [Alphaproteobacteria bacterium]|nr:DNA translocase FtsK [Alphaproteobacteria bacterium]
MVHITRVALRQSAPKLSFGRRAGAAVGQQMMRGLGWLVLLASCALAAAFLTYHPADYSLNSQPFETDHIKNIMGPVGAVVADVLVQAFGWGAYLLLLVLPTWGWRLKSAAALDHFAGRLLMLLAALVSASVMFEMVFPLPQPRLSTSFGGAAGQLVAQMVLPAQPLPWMVLLAAATCVVVAAFATYMSCALSLAEWRGLVHAGHECARSLMRAAAALGRHAIRVLRQAKEQDVIATEHEEIDPPQDTPPDAETKQKVRVAPVRKAAASARQGRLALDRDHESSLPPLELLSPPDPTKSGFQQSDMVLEQQAKALETVLDDFGVQGNITKVSPGPVVTLYELEPAPGIRASRVIALADDIARNMSAASVRVAVVPGRNVMGIELPNRQRETVYMRELLLTPEYQDNRSNLPLILGK